MAGHTPTWTARRYPDGSGWWVTDGVGTVCFGAGDDATACLVAAAPDMEAALKYLLWNFPDLDEVLGGQSAEEARTLLRMAKDALAKAEAPAGRSGKGE